MAIANPNINQVGVGVYIDDGATSLATLRAIRAEMEAIARLGGYGGGSGGSGGYGTPNISEFQTYIDNRERIEMQSIARISRARQEAERPVSRYEVDSYAQRASRRKQLNKEVADQQKRLQQDLDREDARLLAQAERRRQGAARRISTISGASSVFGTEAEIRANARLLQRYRNDPARDVQTDVYRKQVAEQLVAIRQNRQLEREANEQRRQALRESVAAQTRQQNEKFEAEKKQAQIERAEDYKRQQYYKQESDRRTNQYYDRQFSGEGPGGPPIPPYIPGSSGQRRGRFGGSREDNLIGGDLGIVGRITRNILLYEVVSQASYGLVQYVTDSIQAAKATVEFANALRFATEQAGGNVAANQELADSFGPIGLSRQQGRQAVTEAARFAEAQPENVERLTRIVADIAAQRGQGIDRTDELIEQLRRRESKFYKRIFGRTVESIYEDAAAEQLRANPFVGLNLGEPELGKGRNYLTEAEQIRQLVAAMDDEAKEAAVLNFILSQQSKFAGEAEKRAGTLAGRLDKVSAAFLNAKEGVGLFVTDLKVFSDLLTVLEGKFGILDKLRGPELQQSGPGGYATDADLRKYAEERVTGSRAQTLQSIDNFIQGPGLIGAAGIGAAALFGRRQAAQRYQTQQFNRMYPEMFTQFEGNATAATNEARARAAGMRAGFVRSAVEGFRRVTVGMTQSIFEMTASAAQAVGASSVAAKAAARAAAMGGFAGAGGPASWTRSGGTLGGYPVSGVYSPLSQQRELTPFQQGVQGGFSIGGGLAGGIAGFEVGSLVARSMNASTITATVLSITGSVIGTVAGTAAGTALGQAATGGAATGLAYRFGLPGLAVAGAGLVGYGAGSLIRDVGAGLGVPFLGRAKQQLEDEKNLKIEEEYTKEWTKVQKERSQAFKEGRVSFEEKSTGLVFSPKELGERLRQGITSISDYVEIIGPALTGARKLAYEQAQEIEKFLAEGGSSSGVFRLRGQQMARWYATTGYYEMQQEQVSRYREQEQKDREERLSKIKTIEEQAYKVPGEIAQGLTGGDNKFVRPLAAQATLVDEMTTKWGTLGNAMVNYFVKLEQRAINLELVKLRFESLGNVIDIRSRAAREREEYYGPGYSSLQTAAGAAFGVQATGIEQLGSLRLLERMITGRRSFGSLRNVAEDAAFKISLYRQARQRAVEQGGDQNQIADLYSQQITDLASGLDPAVFRTRAGRGLRETIGGAIGLQRQAIARRVEDEYKKVGFQQIEQRRIDQELADAERLRANLISQGFDARDVGAQYDKYILGRNIPIKDLSATQFEQRQGALKREAEREVGREQEARAAIEKGLQLQSSINKEVQIIRTAITGGNTKLLIQLQNNTQARIDQTNLQDSGSKMSNPPKKGR